MPVRQLRLVVTTDDYDAAVRFYRDGLGMAERPSVQPPEGRPPAHAVPDGLIRH